MIQTKTVAILLLLAFAAIGAIGIGTTEHVFAQRGGFGGFGPGQNDNSQGNSNNQQAGFCKFDRSTTLRELTG